MVDTINPPTDSVPQPADESFADSIAAVDQANQQAVRTTMVAATAQDPEKHAQALRLADQFKLPVVAVEGARDQLHQAQKLNAVDTRTLYSQNPRLVSWLLDHDNAVIGQDDLHHLARLDDSAKQLADLLSAPDDTREALPWTTGVAGRYARRGVAGGLDAPIAVAATFEAMGRDLLGKPLTEEDIANPGWSAAATIIHDQQALRDEERAAQTYHESLGQRAVGGLWETLANPTNILLPVAGGAAAAAKATAAGLEAAVAAKAALTGASQVMGEQSALQALSASLDQQQQARIAGQSGPILPGIRDLGNAAVQGGIGYFTGYLGGLRGTLRGLNPAPLTLREVAKDTAIQAAAGGGQGAAGALASQLILPGQELDGGGILESGISGAFGGGAMAGGGALVHLHAQELAAKTRDAQAATATAGILAKACMALVSSKTFARNGERALDLLRQAAGDGTGTVYLQADDLQPLADAAKIPVEVLRDRLGITPEDLAQARATKAALPVDVVKALGEAAKGGEAAVAMAVEKLRAKPGAPNLEEARSFAERLPEEYAAIQKEAEEAAQAGTPSRDLTPTEKIHEDLRSQLIASGMTPERADTNAALWAARYGARAYWFNRSLAADAPNRMDPHHQYLRDGPSVQRALPEILTTNANEFGARLKAAREQRAADWKKQDAAAAKLDQGRHQQADQTATDLKTRAQGPDGQALIDKATEILAAEAKRTGRVPGHSDVMRQLGADFGFRADPGVKLTAEQKTAGDLFNAAMRHRGYDFRLLGEEAGFAAANAAPARPTLAQRILAAFHRVAGGGDVVSPKGDSLEFTDLLRQWRKAHGDRTPVEGSKEWLDLQRQAAEIDAQRGVVYHQAAYHGTGNAMPYDRFRYDRVGGPGGEGAQAYGHGLYFTGKKEIGAWYRDTLTANKRSAPMPEDVSAVMDRASSFGFDDNEQAVHAFATNADWVTRWDVSPEEAAVIRPYINNLKEKGKLYAADIPDDKEMLAWDAPADQQPQSVIAAANAIAAANGHPEYRAESLGASKNRTGKSIYKDLAWMLSPERTAPAEGWTTVYRGDEGNKPASDALLAAGVPGLRYLAGEARAKGEGTQNYVIFDDSRIQIQGYEQRQGAIRGSFDPERNIVRLFEAEDLSTFGHESGHSFLEMLRQDAARPDAPDQIKNDWQTVLEFTKAEGGKLSNDQHETFARAWEAYLQEGKAPSPGLAGVFQRFAAWLSLVYKNLAGISRAAGFEVKLSPEPGRVVRRQRDRHGGRHGRRRQPGVPDQARRRARRRGPGVHGPGATRRGGSEEGPRLGAVPEDQRRGPGRGRIAAGVPGDRRAGEPQDWPRRRGAARPRSRDRRQHLQPHRHRRGEEDRRPAGAHGRPVR